MGFVKHGDNLKILGIIKKDDDSIICNKCGGVMAKQDELIYFCNNCGFKLLLSKFIIGDENEQRTNS